MKCGLKLKTEDSEEHANSCDGCGRKYEHGETYVGEIDSCCGGCYRTLCASCVKAAAEMLKAAMS